MAGSATDMVLNTKTSHDKIGSKISIGNTGASYYYCSSKEGLYNSSTISEEILVGNGNKMLAKKVGGLRCTVQRKNSEEFVGVLQKS
jgi:hypothetical protein